MRSEGTGPFAEGGPERDKLRVWLMMEEVEGVDDGVSGVAGMQEGGGGFGDEVTSEAGDVWEDGNDSVGHAFEDGDRAGLGFRKGELGVPRSEDAVVIGS